MLIDWNTVPKIRNGQIWQHKKRGTMWKIAKASGGGRWFMSSMSGRSTHHTNEKDIYLHFNLIR